MYQKPLDRLSIVDFIIDLFSRRGSDEYMGEPVSMAQHMEQTAACATADGATNDLVIAALLHDIGHFVGDLPIDALESGIDNLHELTGAKFLKTYFPASVTEPIRLHVAAKKYLCAVDEQYFALLSAASVQSLQVQGGPMTKTEIETFESSPYHQVAIQLRRYDDDGKVAGLEIKTVQGYKSTLQSLLLP
jgi:phosphonate degradation associated HDIG domain protein